MIFTKQISSPTFRGILEIKKQQGATVPFTPFLVTSGARPTAVGGQCHRRCRRERCTLAKSVQGNWLLDPPLCGNFKRENDVSNSKPLFLQGCTILHGILWDFRGQTLHMFGMKLTKIVQPAEKGMSAKMELLSSSNDRDWGSKHGNFTIKNEVQPT